MTTLDPTTNAGDSADDTGTPSGEAAQISEAEWRERLTPDEYKVLREAGTERAFTGEYVDCHDAGMYCCRACGAELFDAATKFESGSGWPSFFEAIRPDAVELVRDTSHGMIRTEVRCATCHSHLGHLFPDGPRPTGDRFCMNSLSLRLDTEAAISEG